MLTDSQLLALKQEIENDPESLGYAGKSPAQIADLLNERTFTRNQPIPLRKVLIWGAKTGALARLDVKAKDASSPIQSVCMAALRVLDGAVSSTLDPSDPDVMLLIDTLTQAQIFSGSDRTSLLALQATPASRSEILLGTHVTHLDVSSALT